MTQPPTPPTPYQPPQPGQPMQPVQPVQPTAGGGWLSLDSDTFVESSNIPEPGNYLVHQASYMHHEYQSGNRVFGIILTVRGDLTTEDQTVVVSITGGDNADQWTACDNFLNPLAQGDLCKKVDGSEPRINKQCNFAALVTALEKTGFPKPLLIEGAASNFIGLHAEFEQVAVEPGRDGQQRAPQFLPKRLYSYKGQPCTSPHAALIGAVPASSIPVNAATTATPPATPPTPAPVAPPAQPAQPAQPVPPAFTPPAAPPTPPPAAPPAAPTVNLTDIVINTLNGLVGTMGASFPLAEASKAIMANTNLDQNQINQAVTWLYDPNNNATLAQYGYQAVGEQMNYTQPPAPAGG